MQILQTIYKPEIVSEKFGEFFSISSVSAASVPMAAPANEVITRIEEEPIPQPSKPLYPPWYSPETGIYYSKHPHVNLPSDPFLNVASYIFSQKHNGTHALVDSSSGFSISYPKLSSLVKSIASGLHQMGVKQGDVIMILMPNSVYFPAILLGILSVGAVFTPMNPFSSISEIKKQILDSNTSFAFSTIGKVDELVRVLGELNVVGVPEILNLESGSGLNSVFHKLISCNPDFSPRPKIMQKDIAAIMYSSGTTGKPKGVLLTHGNFIAMMELFIRFEASLYDYPNEDNVCLAVLPMFHVYGLSLFGMGLLSLGSSVVVMKKFDADGMVRAVERYGVTHLHIAPPLMSVLARKSKNGASNSFRSLKQVSCGAAPLTPRNIEDFIEAFPHVDLIQGYGMTECTAVATRGFNTDKCRKYSSVGLLSPNVEAKVVHWVNGSYSPPGKIGELWLRSAGNMKGYLNNIEATKAVLDKDGWLHTGDIVYFDQDGYLYVIDRLKEVIKYKGFQIAPADLEAVLVSHPEVLDAAVTADRDEEAGEIPVAFVVPKEGSSVTPSALMDYVANQVAPYKKVRKVFFTNSLPKSASGKILRRELKSLLTARL